MFVLNEIYSVTFGMIDRCEIARYLSHSEGTCYVSNEALEETYPEDAIVRKHFINSSEILRERCVKSKTH